MKILSLSFAALLALSCVAEPPEEGPAGEPGATAPEFANGAFTAEIEGRLIHYEVHGSGPVLMTLPNSWGLSHQGLRALYRPLEEHLTMVYFDPRGMGESGPVVEESDMSLEAVRDDFDALRRHLGLDRVNAIGWSNGATNLVFLAAERPEILETAIFVHGVARAAAEDFADFPERYPEWAAASNQLREDLAREDATEEEKTAIFRRFNLESAFPYLFADPEAGRRMLATEWADTGFSHRHGAYSQQELGLFDLSEQIAAISTRSLVIAGVHDVLPWELAREIADGVPDGRFVLFSDSGHFAQLEEPEKFVEVVVGFLTGDDGDAGEGVAAEVPPSAADELLARSIAHHDPQGQWGVAPVSLQFEERRPNGEIRNTEVTIDVGNELFSWRSQTGEHGLAGRLDGDECSLSVDGAPPASAEEGESLGLTCERLVRRRDYYTYLWGLPMKLRDPGTRIDAQVSTTEFQGSEVQALRATYDEAVGSDTWHFYFEPETAALAGYRFYHDESQNDGEYITLEGELEVGAMRLPKERAWYYNKDDGYLGTDVLVQGSAGAASPE